MISKRLSGRVSFNKKITNKRNSNHLHKEQKGIEASNVVK